MLIEYTRFVSLNESIKQKEGDKYTYNILSPDNGRMMIPLKKKKEKNNNGLNVGGGWAGQGILMGGMSNNYN